MSETSCPACAEARAEIERLTAKLAKETWLCRLWANGLDGALALNNLFRERHEAACDAFYQVAGMSLAEWMFTRRAGD